MAREFRLPDPGEGIHEAEILEIHVSPSDEVEQDDPLLTIETDKASMEIPSPFTGRIEEIRVSEDDVVEVGDVMLTWSPTEGEEGEEAAESAGEGREPERREDGAEGEADEGSQEAASTEAAEEADDREEEEDAAEPEEAEADRPVPASPATRRLAREREVDLESVEGSGPGGRVTADDVIAAAEAREAAEGPRRAPLGPPPAEPPELPDFERWGEVERVPLRGVRRATARRMALAWSRIPHVTHWDVADITELEEFRTEHREEVEKAGGDLTLTPLIVKAAVAALRAHPRFNATLDEEAGEIVLKRYLHVGVAVATERGLFVPVLRDVERKSVLELAVEISLLAERAREGELERDEMRGGSFTITNPGALGGTSFTPIIHWPQTAILGVARARWEPVVREEEGARRVEPRLRLPLGLGFDHRVADGAEAARFVNRLIEALGDPESLLLRA